MSEVISRFQRTYPTAKTTDSSLCDLSQKCFELLNGISIGLRSGEYCGRCCNVAPAARKAPRTCDFALYRERNLAERFFNKVKHFRAKATRYEKVPAAPTTPRVLAQIPLG